jgi:uncharacterized ferritin-like protein (DUF455 family)
MFNALEKPAITETVLPGDPARVSLNKSVAVLRRFMWDEDTLQNALHALRHIEYVCGYSVKQYSYRYSAFAFDKTKPNRKEVALECLVQISKWINRASYDSGH